MGLEKGWFGAGLFHSKYSRNGVCKISRGRRPQADGALAHRTHQNRQHQQEQGIHGIWPITDTHKPHHHHVSTQFQGT